jgi:hypothetical protein
MGKLILLLVILFGAYWAAQYYKNTKQTSTPKEGEGMSIDELEKFYQDEISKIEKKSVEEIVKYEGLLAYYKTELNKINNKKQK